MDRPNKDQPPEFSVEAPLLYAVAGLDGHLHHRNAAWDMLFGATARPWPYLEADDQALMEACFREVREGKMVSHQVLHVPSVQRDEPVPVLLHAFPVHLPASPEAPPPGSSTPHGVALMGEALAEPTTWVAQQTRRERLASLGHMTMGIAHDFNNLLSAILGHIELMEARLGAPAANPSLAESLGSHLHTLKQATLDGAGIVRKLQRYIRHEKRAAFSPVQLGTLVRDTIALTRPYWYNDPRRKGIRIDVSYEPPEHPLPAVLGDPTELKEVLVNLTLNAVQAMPDGGTLTFSLSRPDETLRERRVCLTVRDTGVGMPPEVQERIFEPLFTTKGESGTGMGMSVSYGIIKEHGGTIEIDSAPNQGTTFRLWLPATSQTQVQAEAPGPEAPTRQSARVLVVDDEDQVRSVLVRLLRLKGYDAVPAASGAHARTLAQTDAFDLVLTDHAMPGMDGHVLARHLRADYPDLPIVMLTGDTDVDGPGDTLDLVLGKPFKIDDLDVALQRLLHQPRPST